MSLSDIPESNLLEADGRRDLGKEPGMRLMMVAWINERKQILRWAEFALLIGAMLGPWGFDLINVPAQYPCSPPYVRLEGDFCGCPLPGAWLLLANIGNIPRLLAMLLSGAAALSDLGREFFVVGGFAIMLGMPILSTLINIPDSSRRSRLAFHLVSWGLALVASLWMGGLLWSRNHWHSWGLWFFILVAAGALSLEIILLAASKKSALNA